MHAPAASPHAHVFSSLSSALSVVRVSPCLCLHNIDIHICIHMYVCMYTHMSLWIYLRIHLLYTPMPVSIHRGCDSVFHCMSVSPSVSTCRPCLFGSLHCLCVCRSIQQRGKRPLEQQTAMCAKELDCAAMRST